MDAVVKEKAVFEVIAPKVGGGVTASDGKFVEAKHMIDGGPSVLFDAIALLTPAAAIEELVKEAAARDFVADAFSTLQVYRLRAISPAAPGKSRHRWRPR